ncbi:MAG: amino acid adenylation domain-containing protein [Myxococcota bacterium]|nr:amino acid adenylation domain-containing protein [Myxococcota bacterium]
MTRAAHDVRRTRSRWTLSIVALPAPEVASLEQKAAAEGAPAEAVVVGAVAALLARYAGREAVSLAVKGRGATELLQVAVEHDPDVRELIRRSTAAMASTTGLEGACPRHVLGGATAGVEVVLVLEGADLPATADLAIRVSGAGAELHWLAERFAEGAIARTSEHLRALLAGMAQGSGSVGAIPLVAAEERAWILACSNVAAVRLDEVLPSVVALFEERARKTPDAAAVVDGARRLAYCELDEAADTLCAQLRACGVGSGVRVAVYLERGADAVVAFLAVLKARGTYVPVDASYPQGRVSAILSCAAPRAIVTRVALASMLQESPGSAGPPSVLLVDALDDGAVPAGATPPPPVLPDDVAYAFFTSGSTGQPKGVVVDHRALANYARAASDAYGVRADDRVLQAASIGFDLSLEELVVTLTAGATLVIRSAAPIESVQSFFDECIAQRLTVLSITSALWHELTMRLADGSVALPPLLRLVILGADVARPDVLALWQRATRGRVRLVNSYGLTETTIVATVWEDTGQALDGDWRAVPIGRPLRNVSAYVLDEARQLVPVGVAGEIWIGGLAVARGYLGDDGLTDSRFVPDPFLPGGRMYRTGDRSVLRSSGELEFLGRRDYQLKVNGVRIELGEIETRLREFPGVIEAVVVVRTNAAAQTELEAHVLSPSMRVTPDELQAHLRRVLPLPTVPARILVADRFPLTPAGKIDRRALAAQPRAVERTPFVAPESPLERLVVATTAEVLGIPDVGVNDGFMSLGGDSLAAVRAASVLEAKLGRRVAGQLFLASKTLRDLCVDLDRSTEDLHVASSAHETLERDARLDPQIAPRPASGTSVRPFANVLLTGATGYYGTFVLADLLRETPAHVICLVRAQTPGDALRRVLASLARWKCPVDATTLASRLTVVCGDVEQRDLGLEAATFRKLSESIDTIFHVAAQVNMLLPYDSLRASNVLAVESVLRLATTGRPKTVHHVSTVEVLADTDRHAQGALAERRASASPALLESGYGQTKWVAEKLVDSARERGVPAIIHRPGRLMGHSSTGAFNASDFLVRLIAACTQVGAAPRLDVLVDFTPVDCASRALVQLAQTGREAAAFHIVHPHPPSWATLLATLAELGYRLRVVPLAKWRSLLHECKTSDGRASFRHYLGSLSQDELEASIRGGYESRVTADALGRDFTWPAVDARLVGTCMRALAEEEGFAPVPVPSGSVLRSSPL